MRKLLCAFAAFLLAQTAFAQADCSSAIVICGNTQPYNPSGVGNKLEQLACGGIEHNSVWLAFQAKANGKLNFVIRPTTLAGLPTAVDVDWSLYRLPGAPGAGNCDNKTQISCNFAGSSTIYGIPGATGMASPPYAASQFNPGVDVTLGTWYVLMIDQFSNTTPILLSVQFTDNTEFYGLNSTPGIFDNKPNFTFTSPAPCSGAYNFTSTGSATFGAASYAWDFGDGSTATTANPSHTYTAPGTYYVTLSVTDGNGCTATTRRAVTYNNTPPLVNPAGLFVTPTCTDANNGTITVVTTGAATPGVTGGTPPYRYELVAPSPTTRPQQSSNLFTGLSAGVYIVKVTDACGKSATGIVTIAQTLTNSLIGLGIQNIQTACNGTSSGTATIFANGSVPPYTMALVNSSPVTTAALPALQRDSVTATYYTTFTGLLPGLYTVEAIDGCGKLRRATFTVAASTAPIATSFTSPSCAGSATGTITVTATAGTGLSGAGAPGTFQYALIAPSVINRPFQNSSVFENLLPGNYTVAVRDICGNEGTANVTVATAPAPNFGTSFSSASCPNGSTGTIEVQNGSSAGGGSPYTFELIAPSPITRPPQNDNLFANLPPGTYTVRLKDVCGTSAITTVAVAAATAPTFTSTVTASCTTPAAGTLTVTPGASALGPFSFELISPGAAIRPPQGSNIANTSNSIFTGLSQGAYTVKMTDGCGVAVTGTATIAAPTPLVLPAGSTTTPSCAAGSTGQLTIAAPTTGLGAYKYELIAPSPVTRPPQYSRIFSSLPTGNYVYRITDSCGTQVDNAATPITIAAASAPSFLVTNTASCATSSGTITCQPNSNQGPGTYLYALIAPSPVTRPNQASPIFTGLPAGNYTVQITDGCGQTNTTTTTIAAAGAFSPAAGGSIVACNGSGYYAQIIVTTPQNFTPGGPIPPGSGGGPYTYSIYDATNTTLIAGPQSSNIFSTITPLAGAPSHTIRVTDACGNTSTTTVTMNPPGALTAATISATTASCAGSNTGVIKVTTGSGGGLIPYRYSLINATTLAVVAGPQTSTTFDAVPDDAVGYFVRTTDACGNTITSGTALPFPAAVVPTATVATVPSCATPATGSITVTPGTGATLGGGTFSYALYDAGNTVLIRPSQASPVFANLAPASYTVRITDRCGSTGTAAATVASGVTAPTATAVATGTCTGGSSGSVRGGATNGSLPLSFTLVDAISTSVVAGPQADSIFSGLSAGTYFVRVTDACGTVTNSSNVVLGDLVTAPTISTTSALDCAGTAQISAYGGGGSSGPYTYAICSGAGCSSFGAFGSSSTFTVNTSGTYRVAVRDRCGLQTSSADIVIVIPPKPVITGATKGTACGTTSFTVNFTGISNTPYYSVDGSNFSPTLPSLDPGCHSVRVADFNAGVFGCASDPFNVSVFAAPTLRTATTANGWTVNCTTGDVTPALQAGTGNTGCAGSGASFGVKLTACTGCNGLADPIGTVRAAGGSFKLNGATSATFAPAILVGGTDICTGSTVAATFVGGSFACLTSLPILIEYFNGQKQTGGNLLRWKLDCQSTGGLEVTLERSGTGLNGSYTGIYQQSLSDRDCINRFEYPDLAPLPGTNYYRLAVRERSGAVVYSQVVVLRNTGTGFDIITIQPNPASAGADAILHIANFKPGKLTVSITDAAGKQVVLQSFGLLEGNNQLPLNVAALAGGVYQVKCVAQDGTTRMVRFVKQ